MRTDELVPRRARRAGGALLFVLALSLGAGSCGEEDPLPTLAVAVEAEGESLVRESLGFIEGVRFDLEVVADPGAAADAPGALRLALAVDASCAECYRIERAAHGLVVRGGLPLGLQYGLAHALELYGLRFFSPSYTVIPPRLRLPAADAPGLAVDHAPELARRGLHLHTIHPTEAYYALWEPGQEQLAEAKRIVDWALKNRANYVQWVGLDDIQAPGADVARWQAHTRAIVEYLHARGATAGLAIQLFGQSNLQQGFDLVDSEDPLADPRPEIEARLPVIFEGIDFDNVNLSFGEFFGAEPARFIETVDTAYEVLMATAPQAEMSATIHLGADDKLRVEYEGESLIYYFLVKFANAAIVPWVHSVMYYNLFDDAGGAYHHERFDEHLAYLLERLAGGERVGYFPETAYWVAFDNSVPFYAPLYVRSRWRDLAELRKVGAAPLEDHVLFSSGWEWGYWQNDYASLRASYELPATYQGLFDDMFAALGEHGRLASEIAGELAELQHGALIEGRLAAYLAGRDFYIDVGDEVDIRSQPDRPEPDEVAAMAVADKEAFRLAVVEELARFATAVEGLLARLRAAGVSRSVRWFAELVDGVEVTAARTRFIEAVYRAALGAAGDAEALLTVDRWFDAGLAVVQRRHADLHDPQPERLLYGTTNATYYQWGYLKQAHELCYWDRERVKVRNALTAQNAPIPTCVF